VTLARAGWQRLCSSGGIGVVDRLEALLDVAQLREGAEGTRDKAGVSWAASTTTSASGTQATAQQRNSTTAQRYTAAECTPGHSTTDYTRV
jgi:hypothetical protein